MKVSRIEIDQKDFVDAEEIAEHENFSKQTARRIMGEIEKLEEEKFYPQWATYRNGGRIFRVSYLVLRHYLKYADRIREKNLKKTVPAFDPDEIKQFLGIDRIKYADM